jgi:hypothetical protein
VLQHRACAGGAKSGRRSDQADEHQACDETCKSHQSDPLFPETVGQNLQERSHQIAGFNRLFSLGGGTSRLGQCSGMSLDAAGSNRAEARLDSSGAHPLRALARTRRRGRRDRVHRCDRVALPRYGSRDRDRRTPAPQGGDSLSRGDSTPVRRYLLGALWAAPVLRNVTRARGPQLGSLPEGGASDELLCGAV